MIRHVCMCGAISDQRRCAGCRSKATRSPSSRRTGRRDWQTKRKRILTRDLNVCHYCGGHATTVDHVIAVVNGGTDEDSNLVAACGPCNASKGGR